MNDSIERRCRKVARHIIEHRDTVRQAAKELGISKSTVHKDIVERLPQIDARLAEEAKEVLAYNKGERHLRGGAAIQLKYQMLRKLDKKS